MSANKTGLFSMELKEIKRLACAFREYVGA